MINLQLYLGMALIFSDFHMGKAHFLLEYLSAPEPSSGKLGKFQQLSVSPKNKSAVLFLKEMCWLLLYISNTFSYRPPL